jgi:two-component system, OmpR family, response regulator
VARAATARVLVVDDERSITDVVATALRYQGFEVKEAASGRAALAAAASFRPDFIVLDVMLPDLDGFEVARRLRAGGVRTPLLFLTAKDATEDKLSGLDLGDDYVTKPFSLEEVIARVRTVLRRSRPDTEADGVQRFADLVLDDRTHEVFRGGTRIHLTATEFRLLRYLMRNPRQVLSKAQILDHVWDHDFDGDENVVETFVSYLRRKLDRTGPPLIHTIRLVGYCLRLPPSEDGGA